MSETSQVGQPEAVRETLYDKEVQSVSTQLSDLESKWGSLGGRLARFMQSHPDPTVDPKEVTTIPEGLEPIRQLGIRVRSLAYTMERTLEKLEI